MSEYIIAPIDTDPIDILDEAYSELQSFIPGWEPSDGQLDAWIIQSMASQAAESRDVVSGVTKSIFRWFGAYLVNLPPIDSSAAQGNSTWVMIDMLGHTIPAGTQVGITDSGGNVIPFEVQDDVVVLPGSNATPAGAVVLIAVDSGATGSGLGSAGSSVTLLDPLDYVLTVTLTATTSGGQDAESDDDYLNRLSQELTLLAPRPILPNDFTLFARKITGVWRAVAIDGYNPAGGGTYGNDRTVSIAAVDQAGNPVSAPVKANIDADLQARREQNFNVFVIDPTTSTVDVTWRVKALPGYNTGAVLTDVNNALTSYLDPATWGTPDNDSRGWIQKTTVRYLELAQVINEVQGVDYIVNLTFRIAPAAYAIADVVLPGVAPLPHAGILTGTVDP